MPVYTDSEISFTVDSIQFRVSNFAFGPFAGSMPSHSHGPGSYEIHYVPYGYGTLKLQKESRPIIPNTLYITGPGIEHAQIPAKENPMVEYCIYLRAEPLARTSKKFRNFRNL